MAATPPFHYRFQGGPFEGPHGFARMLGEWVVLFADERQQPVSAGAAFALVGYQQDPDGGGDVYRFRHCMTPALQRFYVEYADGPFKGTEISALPAIWLPAELIRPLDAQARAIRGPDAFRSHASLAVYLAHYQRRDSEKGNTYHLSKITRPMPAEPGRAA